MSDFFRFPHTPHIAWLGKDEPRDDKLLSVQEAEALLADEVVVEEKLDGANLGISLAPDRQLRVQNRGHYLIPPLVGQFSRLTDWLETHRLTLTAKLDSRLVVFGEWCAARHSMDYDALPDWFVMFDVYDREQEKFWSSARRNLLAKEIGISVVPQVLCGRVTLSKLKALLVSQDSHFRHGKMEGIVVRRESADWCVARAKLVRAEFTQAITGHWRGRAIIWNRVRLSPCDRVWRQCSVIGCG
ncbi:MAG: DNA ligase [Lysobacterales bacterium CG02_land_8_20_14_3_00_62_12]|nr:MAG: DNA ligase [Xanthomonadales bacterium CG02_land_8_20_14_3_00_62_12]PJA38248.1 MAG: DNA ligase [Xanthomonadales bacterium CG_4_9_14_3_um_filter_62_6]